MTLSEYMRLNNLDDAAMAGIVGCTRPHISKLRRGIARPSLGTMGRISKVTAGKVQGNDWVDLHPPTDAAE